MKTPEDIAKEIVEELSPLLVGEEDLAVKLISQAIQDAEERGRIELAKQLGFDMQVFGTAQLKVTTVAQE